MQYKELKNAVFDAKYSSPFDGWPLLLESVFLGVFALLYFNNAIVGLGVSIITFKLLKLRIVGTFASVALAGLSAYFMGQKVFLASQRWDFGIAVGLIVLFVVYRIHQYHVKSVER